MSTKKDARILGIRLEEADAVILAEIEETTTMTPVSVARAAIKAVILRWQATNNLVLPFHIVTSAELAKMNASPVNHEANRQTANIVDLPPQSTTSSENDIALLSDAKATGTDDLPAPKKVSYGSGKSRKKSS